MAKKSDKAEKKDGDGVNVVSDEGSVDIVEVVHPGEDASAEFSKGQDEALLHYRLTGEPGVFIDPLRDQEPDIAPELGVAPHPELANPAPPGIPFGGVALDQSKNEVVVPFKEKQENAEKEEERVQSVADAVNEANKEAADAARERGDEDVEDAPELSKEDALNLHLTPDESPKSAGSAGPSRS